MEHPFAVLKPEYERLLASMIVRRERIVAVDQAARLLLDGRHLPLYQAEARETGVPAVLLAALDFRENSGDITRAIGQGDPWNEVSTHTPQGHGPFKSKYEADIHYIRYDRLHEHSAPWSWPYLLWKAEAFNGFGARNHGINSPYLWSATNHYVRGKYVKDGVWDANFVDRQLGVVPIMRRMVELHSDLGFEQLAAPPIGVRPPTHSVAWLQDALNRVLDKSEPLLIDGSFGRLTRAAVRQFQQTHGLEVDGVVGPQTEAALERAMVPVKETT